MRISKAGLLIVLALLAPVIVELRVVFGWAGIELTALETAAIGLVLVAAVLVWAFLPENGDDGPSETDVSRSKP